MSKSCHTGLSTPMSFNNEKERGVPTPFDNEKARGAPMPFDNERERGGVWAPCDLIIFTKNNLVNFYVYLFNLGNVICIIR